MAVGLAIHALFGFAFGAGAALNRLPFFNKDDFFPAALPQHFKRGEIPAGPAPMITTSAFINMLLSHPKTTMQQLPDGWKLSEFMIPEAPAFVKPRQNLNRVFERVNKL